MHAAIANTFIEYKYAFMTLESYMMALKKQLLSVSILLTHMDIMLWPGMPDPNGIVFIIQFANVLDVEQYLYALSNALHSNLFELRLRKVNCSCFAYHRIYVSQLYSTLVCTCEYSVCTLNCSIY